MEQNIEYKIQNIKYKIQNTKYTQEGFCSTKIYPSFTEPAYTGFSENECKLSSLKPFKHNLSPCSSENMKRMEKSFLCLSCLGSIYFPYIIDLSTTFGQLFAPVFAFLSPCAILDIISARCKVDAVLWRCASCQARGEVGPPSSAYQYTLSAHISLPPHNHPLQVSFPLLYRHWFLLMFPVVIFYQIPPRPDQQK